MKLRKNNSGFSVFLILMFFVFVAAVGLAFYQVAENSKVADQSDSSVKKSNSDDSSEVQKDTNIANDNLADAPEIKKSSDLDEATKTLDSIDVESSESDSQLDQDVSSFSN